MEMIVKNLKLMLVTAMITIPSLLWAQTPTDPPPPADPPQNDADLPFDGGVSLLVAAGIGYGLKKVHDRKKTEKYKGI